MYENLTKGVALLALLFFQTNTGIAQNYFDLGGVDFANPNTYHYDSASSGFYGIAYSQPSFNLGFNYMTNYIIRTDKNGLVIDTVRLKAESTDPWVKVGFRGVGKVGDKMLAYNVNLQNIHNQDGGFALSKWEYCSFEGDTIKDCISLFPDSIYSDGSGEPYLNPQNDTLHLFSRGYSGPNDTLLKEYWIRFNTQTGQKKISEISILDHENIYYINYLNTPLKLSNGDWLAMTTRFNPATNSVGISLIRVSHDWKTVKSAIPHPFWESTWTKMWEINNKVVISTTGDFREYTGSTSVAKIRAPLTLMVYDLQHDSISDSYNFGILDEHNQFQHHEAFAASFNNEYFVLSGRRWPRKYGSEQNASIAFIMVDTNFNEVRSFLIEDTLNDPFLGLATDIVPVPGSNDFFYTGIMGNKNLSPSSNAYFPDLMFGRFGPNDVGIDEKLVMRKQETWLYPNPSKGTFVLDNRAEHFEPYEFEIFDSMGRKVLDGKADAPRYEVDTDLAAGNYFLKTEMGEILPIIITR